MVDQPLRSFYMYDAVGVYQTQADLQKYPVMQNSKVGDVRYRDANGDGVINDSDRTLDGQTRSGLYFRYNKHLQV